MYPEVRTLAVGNTSEYFAYKTRSRKTTKRKARKKSKPFTNHNAVCKKLLMPRGLKNKSGQNVCFLNSALQLLRACEPFVELCSKRIHSTSCTVPHGRCFMCSVERTILNTTAVQSTGQLAKLFAIIEDGYNYKSQYDASCVISKIMGSFRVGPRFPEKGIYPAYHQIVSKYLDQMSCLMKTTVKCKNCDHHNSEESPVFFYPCALDKDKDNVLKRSKHVIQRRCQCDSSESVAKTRLIETNKYTFVRLNRQMYKCDRENGHTVFSTYRSDKKVTVTPDYVFKEDSYKAVAWVSHRGTTSGGHYVAHRKFDGDVYEYNDDRMSLQREKEIENDDDVTIILLLKTTN